MSFVCPEMSSNDVTTRLAAASARSLPLIFVCSLGFFCFVGCPILILYQSVETMVVISDS